MQTSTRIECTPQPGAVIICRVQGLKFRVYFELVWHRKRKGPTESRVGPSFRLRLYLVCRKLPYSGLSAQIRLPVGVQSWLVSGAGPSPHPKKRIQHSWERFYWSIVQFSQMFRVNLLRVICPLLQ